MQRVGRGSGRVWVGRSGLTLTLTYRISDDRVWDLADAGYGNVLLQHADHLGEAEGVAGLVLGAGRGRRGDVEFGFGG